MSTTYERHRLGRFLPAMNEEDFKRLCADIAAQGLLEDIVLYEGKILDGWSRYRACQYSNVEPRFREFGGDNPVAYVLAKNVQRRHLHPVQVLRILEHARPALEAEAVARKRAGIRQATPPSEPHLGPNLVQGGRVSEQIAEMAGVSKGTVIDYRTVQLHGAPELKEAVDREEVSISDAAQVARSQPPDEQTAAVARVRAGEASTLRQAVKDKAASEPAVDPLGIPIPDGLRAAFAPRCQFEEVERCLSRAQKLVSQIQAGPAAGLLHEQDWRALARQLGSLRSQLEQAEPYAVCPFCLGSGCGSDGNRELMVCRGSGCISRWQCQRLAKAS